MHEHGEHYQQLMRDIEAQMKAAREKKPPGDRRREHIGPPQGMAERRTQPDRRCRGQPPAREPEQIAPL